MPQALSSDSPLANLSQTIHATLLSPPRQFLLVTTVTEERDYIATLSLFSVIPNPLSPKPDIDVECHDHAYERADLVRVWTEDIELFEGNMCRRKEDIADAIREGLLHVDCGPRRAVDLSKMKKLQLHFLVKPEPMVFDLVEAELTDHAAALLRATYTLSSAPKASSSKDNGSELRDLRAQLSQKDDEIAVLNSRLASMKATVVRATASDNKKVHQSPQKAKPPANASKLQPNQKRRKAVEDEFAGSSDEEED
ncbi:hypothetical protein I316_00854 [Kwoniella heveanensis BCC8398]|uniref:Uncharacterized protein n=1 Tax=Kwoniella heveanensis BCC8398 TaxID=1296120 RepID=A0A1B9H395_9TREE|nr:hypothetical protein I316_00854 [Kwoniella heveanensis BCC8398]